MKYVRYNDDGKIHLLPLHTNRTLCGDERPLTRATETEGPGTCEWCLQSLEDLLTTLSPLRLLSGGDPVL
jgi:hypothetical protein